ncbi:hypothetical protein BJY52DRAFT_1133667 [Lactarius psammicola]|nr:hypothetical protein BJY52DRAFT_1133667 [Lactarius psammicola]
MDNPAYPDLDIMLQCLSDNGYSILSLVTGILSQYNPDDLRLQSAQEDLERDAVGVCTCLLGHAPTSLSVSTWAHHLFEVSEQVLGDLGEDDPEEADERGPQKRSRRDVPARNTALQVIKSVICISIILQSVNENCNHLQGIIGMFVHSANVPQHVIEVLAHAGLSISIKSIQRAVKSMSTDSAQKIRESLRSLKVAMAYDNFDINFKTLEPTIAHCSSFVSATSATAIPLVGVENVDVLRCSVALWSVDPRNLLPLATPISFDEFDLLKFHVMDTYDRCAPEKEFSPRQEVFAWHIHEILINHGRYFAHLSGQLGAPESVLMIPLMKTEQIPMRSMKIKQSSVDGNIEVMENLLRQGGLGDPTDPGFDTSGDVDISDFVLLIHGDLLTKERLDTVRDSRQIEDTPRHRFQYMVFVPGLFHYKMACVDAIWRTYLQSKEGRKDVNSTFQHAGILRPQETGILTTKPGFR